jgi:2,4-dienoyl-CoA reductase (NADPH2)
MSKEDVKQEIKNHIDGARRAIEAGFDGIEVSGIVGYLVSNFNSKYTNKRTDEYGGSVEGRARFMCEILQGIRKEIGRDYPLMIRLCGEELLDDRGGNTPEECTQMWKLAEACDIDLLSVTAGWQESPASVITRDIPMGSWIHVAERAKQTVKCPVAMAYRLRKPIYPERAIAEGKLDYWEMCRPMIAEPHLPLKVLEGREEDVIPCMSCNLCLARLFRDQPIVCMVNPRLGHYYEPEWEVSPTPQKKKVVVIGGGVAGLQCAAIAAQQGHDVTLYEKSDHVGGQLTTAGKGPYGDEELQEFVDYLATQCKKNGVKIVLNHEVTEKQFSDPLHNPDAIVVATGARGVAPQVPGADRSNVVTAHDAMDGKVQVGERCLVIGGRGVGIGVALFLANNGKQVSVVESAKKLGRDVNPSYIWRYVKMLKGHKVQMFTQSSVKSITDDGVTVVGPDGQKTVVPVDTVVLATMQANKELVEPLEFACGELYTIGDASTPRRAHNAALEGYRTGLRI